MLDQQVLRAVDGQAFQNSGDVARVRNQMRNTYCRSACGWPGNPAPALALDG